MEVEKIVPKSSSVHLDQYKMNPLVDFFSKNIGRPLYKNLRQKDPLTLPQIIERIQDYNRLGILHHIANKLDGKDDSSYMVFFDCFGFLNGLLMIYLIYEKYCLVIEAFKKVDEYITMIVNTFGNFVSSIIPKQHKKISPKMLELTDSLNKGGKKSNEMKQEINNFKNQNQDLTENDKKILNRLNSKKEIQNEDLNFLTNKVLFGQNGNTLTSEQKKQFDELKEITMKNNKQFIEQSLGPEALGIFEKMKEEKEKSEKKENTNEMSEEFKKLINQSKEKNESIEEEKENILQNNKNNNQENNALEEDEKNNPKIFNRSKKISKKQNQYPQKNKNIQEENKFIPQFKGQINSNQNLEYQNYPQNQFLDKYPYYKQWPQQNPVQNGYNNNQQSQNYVQNNQLLTQYENSFNPH